jgi:hypothetical protein
LTAQYSSTGTGYGWMIGDTNGKPVPTIVTLKRGMTAQFTALEDEVIQSGPHNWAIMGEQFATVDTNGLVTINKLFVGQIILFLLDADDEILACIAIRIIM